MCSASAETQPNADVFCLTIVLNVIWKQWAVDLVRTMSTVTKRCYCVRDDGVLLDSTKGQALTNFLGRIGLSVKHLQLFTLAALRRKFRQTGGVKCNICFCSLSRMEGIHLVFLSGKGVNTQSLKTVSSLTLTEEENDVCQ